MGLSRVYVTKLPDPYNNCVQNFTDFDYSNSALVKEILSLNKTYRQSDCFDLCFYETVVAQCKCNSSLNLVNEECRKSQNMSSCYDKEDRLFYENDVYQHCAPKCPLECDSIRFTITTSLAEYPGLKLN